MKAESIQTLNNVYLNMDWKSGELSTILKKNK